MLTSAPRRGQVEQRALFATPRAEERLEPRSRVGLEYAADHLGADRKAAVAHDVVEGSGSAGLVVPRAEHQARDVRLQKRAGAHEARLERDDERALAEVPAPEGPGRLTHRDDFRVGARVGRLLAAVATGSDDRAVGAENHRADRHFPGRGSLIGKHECSAHVGDELRWGVHVPQRTRDPKELPARGTYADHMRVHIADHPLITHKLTVLRDATTPSPMFRQLTEELMTLLAYEATRSVRVEECEVTTPVTTTTGVKIADPKPLVVPILRAGLGMLEGMTKLIPTAEVGFLGLVRDEETLKPTTYAERLPDNLAGRQCFALDPMLATGGSLAAAITYLFDRGATEVTAVCLLGTPEGVHAIEGLVGDRDVTLVLGALDERLDQKGFIVPGLGDAGDRLYGTTV